MTTPTPTYTTPRRALTILITGSSSGFGLSLTRLFLTHGHTVIATSRHPARMPHLVSEVQHAGGQYLPLDVTDPNSASVIHELEAAGTHIDVLVNNAGYSVFAAVETTTEEELRAQMEVGFFGPVRLIQAALGYMRGRRSGMVVNFSSGAALRGNMAMGAYAGAKAGLDGLSRVLAQEVAPFNIRVLTVGLGTFNTNFGNGSKAGVSPLPDDYRGTMVEKITEMMTGGNSMQLANGDKDLAMKALYEVIVGEGVGKGKESQQYLPLGKDLYDRVNVLRDYLGDSLYVFGDVTKSVALPGK